MLSDAVSRSSLTSNRTARPKSATTVRRFMAQEVRGFEVPVKNTEVVGDLQGVGDLDDEPCRLVLLESTAPLQFLTHGAACVKRHREVWQPITLTDFESPAKVRVVESLCQPHLPEEPFADHLTVFPGFRVVSEREPGNLERDIIRAWLRLGQEHSGHPTTAELAT